MIYLILEDLRSLYNIGAIFRTAESAGVAKIFLLGYSGIIAPNILNPKISKTAVGTENILPWENVQNLDDIISKFKNKISLISLEQTKNADNIFDFKFSLPVALIVGNEKNGVSQSSLRKSQAVVHIPMFGTHNSLNVAQATAIALYHIKINSVKRT